MTSLRPGYFCGNPAALAGGFSPAALSGLALWLKADGTLWQDSARTTRATADADPVGAWDDASGNASHVLQATAGKRPTLKLAIQNSRPVLRFDGVDDFLQATFTLVQPTYVAFVAMLRAGTANARTLDGKNVDCGDVYQSSSDLVSLYAGGAIVVGPSVGHTQFHLVEVLFSGAASYVRPDQGATTTGNPGTNPMAGITLGAGATPSNYATVDVGELVVCTAEPSNRAALAAYLKSGWGTP